MSRVLDHRWILCGFGHQHYTLMSCPEIQSDRHYTVCNLSDGPAQRGGGGRVKCAEIMDPTTRDGQGKGQAVATDLTAEGDDG